MYKAKHYNHKFTMFGKIRGKHSKDELIVYNPVYAKISACISSLAVTTSFFACATFGKYKTTLASSDTARAAKYVLNLSSSENSITNFVPNTTRSIEFDVKNFEGALDSPTQVNQVSLRYFINIKYDDESDLPLEYALFRITHQNNQEVSTQIPLTDNKSAWIDVSDITELHEYRLDVTWPLSAGNSATYGNLEDRIIVTAEFEQLDI